ncbi:MAG: HAD-IC family P-type ATPase [Acidimicrobiia bacterium]
MVTTDRGLSARGLEPEEVRARVEAGQVNLAPDGPSRTTAEIVRANLVTRFNILLGVLLVVPLVVLREPRDALFGIVLVANAAIGIVQELRAKRTLDRLELLTAPKARVLRSGGVIVIAVEELVVDDIVELRSGDQLTVDGLVVIARGLEINESLLTGESDPVRKEVGDQVLSGSFVAAGSGRYRVTHVGAEAYAVKLALEAKKFTLVRSELRDGIDWIIGAIGWTIGPAIALVVWSQMRAEESFHDALRSAVAQAVGMVPQGLVLLTSMAFAVGVIRLGRRNVLVKELPAIEGLARVDTVCFDKTGTLTEGRLTVNEIVLLDGEDPAQPLAALAASDPDPNATLAAVGAAYPTPPGWAVLSTVPFSSARKWSGAAFAGHGSWVLGAPDVIAPTDADVGAHASEASESGQRVLLLARSDRPLSTTLPDDVAPSALVILGDRIRPDAAETLRFFADQGVVAKVISGDHPETVAAVARAVGVVGSSRYVDASNLPEDPDELAAVVEANTVFGRVTPHQKRAMVAAMQRRGHVVAMTGDGVNDVLALKDSDIGIAVGGGGAASRAVAQLVLIDGRFASLPGVVGEGRRVIANIERVANLFLTKTIYAIGIALAVGFATVPFPFLPRHLTLIGAVTIGIPSFFLALAPSAKRTRPGFVGRVLRFAVPTGIIATLAAFAGYQLAIAEEVSLEQARTTAVIVLTAIGLFALAIVSRPFVPWKTLLVTAMTALTIVGLASQGSRAFFELELPPVVVLLAAIGIVAITGAVMVIALRMVGWAKAMPELLREMPPPRPSAWGQIGEKVWDMSGWRRSFPGSTEVPVIETNPTSGQTGTDPDDTVVMYPERR